MNTDTAARQSIRQHGELPINLLGIGLARGTAVHLFEEDGDRTETLCDKRIRVNPRYLGIRSQHTLSSDEATCRRCVKAAQA